MGRSVCNRHNTWLQEARTVVSRNVCKVDMWSQEDVNGYEGEPGGYIELQAWRPRQGQIAVE